MSATLSSPAAPRSPAAAPLCRAASAWKCIQSRRLFRLFELFLLLMDCFSLANRFLS